MNIIVTIILASIAQFIVGAIWYMPLFGNMWGKIHGFASLSKSEQKAAQKQMMPMLAVQFVGTVVTTVVLAEFMKALPDLSPYYLVMLIWVGFYVPTQVSAVIFGGTEGKWVVAKSLIMMGGALACLLVAVTVLQLAI